MRLTRELPRYSKQVWALKIAAIIPNPRGWELHFEDEGYAPVEVSQDWLAKHDPQPGHYFVVNQDGPATCMPALAFERDYTRET